MTRHSACSRGANLVRRNQLLHLQQHTDGLVALPPARQDTQCRLMLTRVPRVPRWGPTSSMTVPPGWGMTVSSWLWWICTVALPSVSSTSPTCAAPASSNLKPMPSAALRKRWMDVCSAGHIAGPGGQLKGMGQSRRHAERQRGTLTCSWQVLRREHESHLLVDQPYDMALLFVEPLRLQLRRHDLHHQTLPQPEAPVDTMIATHQDQILVLYVLLHSTLSRALRLANPNRLIAVPRLTCPFAPHSAAAEPALRPLPAGLTP